MQESFSLLHHGAQKDYIDRYYIIDRTIIK